jgi:hypothetical protein
MTTPVPRPALKKSADAHIHPAAPGNPLHALRPAPPEDPDAPGPEGAATTPPDGADTAGSHRLSGPLHGTTSDSLRNATRKAHRPPKGKAADKLVDLGVKVPKSVRKDFRAAVKADKKDPDAVVTALLKAWLGT